MFVENRNFFILPAFDAPLGGPHRNVAMTFGVEKP